MSTQSNKATLPSEHPSKSFWHVEPSPLLLGHRSTRALPEHADVVVIGSGITGTSVAWHLLQGEQKVGGRSGGDVRGSGSGKGLKVVMLEAREACWGATGRNGGHCQPILFEHPSDPSIGHFELRNLAALTALCSSLDIDCEFHEQQGVRALYSTEDFEAAKTSLAELHRRDAALAAHMRVVSDPTELKKLRIPTATGAVVTDVAARLWPYKLVSRLLEDLLTSTSLRGAFNLQTHTAVTALQPGGSSNDGRWEVQTPRGSVRAAAVVLATNAYTSFLLGDYADLIVPVRGQMSALLPPAPQLAGRDRLQTSFGFLGPAQDDYLIQREARVRGGGSEQLLYGGGRSQGLSLGVCDDETVDAETAAYLRGALVGLLGVEGCEEGHQLEATHEWTGIMGFSRDDKPFVGPVPGHGGVFVSAGYTGHGMPNAWLCGKGVADMVGKTLAGGSTEEAVVAAVEEGGLPRAYVLDEDRIAGARRLETVAAQDRLGYFKAEYAE